MHRLNFAYIPTSIDYALSKGLEGNYEHGDGSWNSSSVKYILINHTYIGDLQQGEKGILVENTHEALVSRDIFLNPEIQFQILLQQPMWQLLSVSQYENRYEHQQENRYSFAVKERQYHGRVSRSQIYDIKSGYIKQSVCIRAGRQAAVSRC